MTGKGIHLICLLTVLLFSMSACSKKEDVPAPVDKAVESAPATIQNDTASEASPPEPKIVRTQKVNLDTILDMFNTGKKEQAAQLFLAMKWDRPDVLNSGSVFGISESEFLGLSIQRQQELQQEAIRVSGEIRNFLRFLVEQAKQEGTNTPAYREALLAFGQRLSEDNQLALIQQTGQAVMEYVKQELSIGN